MTDPTEATRRDMIASGQPYNDLKYATQRWTTDELCKEFDVTSFFTPFVLVRRKSDGILGLMEFTNNPRVYFNFVPDK